MADPLPSIADEFVCSDDCPICDGWGIVCEDHPNRRWEQDDSDGGCNCGAPGMPCLGPAAVHA